MDSNAYASQWKSDDGDFLDFEFPFKKLLTAERYRAFQSWMDLAVISIAYSLVIQCDIISLS